jgi:alkylation response protein AidB-like acyl-CoA dehydrogenase
MHDLELTEEQVMIRDMARDFARGEIAPHAQAWEKAALMSTTSPMHWQ